MKVQSIIISVFLVLLSTGCEKIPIPDSYYSYLEDTEVANYTKIYTADDLAAIANNLSGSYLLMNDIDLSNYGDWGSIGGYSGEFTGVFNGGDNTISNLNGSNGLFGRIKDANISNIILENPNIKGSSFVGGIVGSAENSYIISCAVIGGSIASTSTTSSYVGGIAGSLGCDIDDKTAMVGCYSSSTVSGNDDPVGGLVGSCIYPLIVGCYSVGDVHSNGEDVGNVAGSASNTQACYYVKHADSNLDIGVANLSGNATSVTLSVLNSTAVSAMNSAISDSGYSSVKYTAGSPTNEYLPSLMGEKVSYVDNYNESSSVNYSNVNISVTDEDLQDVIAVSITGISTSSTTVTVSFNVDNSGSSSKYIQFGGAIWYLNSTFAYDNEGNKYSYDSNKITTTIGGVTSTSYNKAFSLSAGGSTTGQVVISGVPSNMTSFDEIQIHFSLSGYGSLIFTNVPIIR